MKRENIEIANKINERIVELESQIEKITTAECLSFTSNNGYPIMSFLFADDDLAASFALKCMERIQEEINSLINELDAL